MKPSPIPPTRSGFPRPTASSGDRMTSSSTAPRPSRSAKTGDLAGRLAPPNRSVPLGRTPILGSVAVAALIVSIVAVLIAGIGAYAAVVSARAAKMSADEANGTRLTAQAPSFELTPLNDPSDGPQLDLLLTRGDLIQVVAEVVQGRADDVGGVPPVAGLSESPGGTDALRLDLGEMRIGERRRLTVSRYYGDLEGVTVRLRLECSRGHDRWVVGTRTTYPARKLPPGVR